MTMTINEALIDRELQRVLWACLAYWSTEPNPPDKRAVCYSWVARRYQDRFAGTFHQSRLHHLALLGLLAKDDTSRGGNRQYYRINDPAQLAEFLKGCNLN
jgi:hypothetical protein